jgi:hypothetical protein
MADEKKKPEEEGWNLDAFEWVYVVIFALAIISSFVPMVWRYVTSGEVTFFGYNISNIFDFFKNNVQLIKAIGFILTGAAAIATFVYNRRADAVWREEKAKIYPDNIPIPTDTAAPNPVLDKWKKIVEDSESDNPSDWRLAIIEADIMLDDLLLQLRLPGETMGEKLKAVEPSDFTTIESAWEAHKARNMIAHQGSDYAISKREVRRIISLYEAVFKEFGII